MSNTASKIAKQHLSLLGEVLLGDESVESISSVLKAMVDRPELRKSIALIVRDYCSHNLRPEIKKFAGLMEMKLRKHDPVRGQSWKLGPTNNIERIRAILDELELAVEEGRRVGTKAADLANHAMMLADRAGELEDV